MDIRDFLGFEKLVSTTLIKIGYWVGIALILIAGVINLGVLLVNAPALYALLALVGIVFGLLLWRVLCELFIVTFGIYERLGAIRDSLARR